MSEEKQLTTIWTPANIVTCIRVVFVPIWVAFAVSVGATSTTGNTGAGIAAAIAFAILSLTDKLDGYLARSRNEVTRFGKFLDPIADKLVVVCSFLVLMDWGYINLWVIIVIVAREFLVSALRMVVATDGVVIAASNLGKWKTATTMGCIAGYLVVAAIPNSAFANILLLISQFALAAALVLTIWSGVDYFLKTKDYLFSTDQIASRDFYPDEERPEWSQIVSYASNILDKAREAGVTIGTAESCTGGLVEGALTAVPGSSDVVKGCIGSYANNVKHDVLHVTHKTLDTKGAVSSECAEEMAYGACEALGCDIAVSVTGIAGPGGGTPEKPVGLVWFGSSRDGMVYSESVEFPGDREEVRLRAVIHALDLISRSL